jgi:ABC-2 type transport system ATP-binding protein
MTSALATNAIATNNLSKRWGNKIAVDGISLSIQKGVFYALLGPNGAGKTTFLRMITGTLRQDSGKIQILEHDLNQSPASAKQEMGFLADDPQLYAKLYPLEYLELVAALWKVPSDVARQKSEELLKSFNLWEAATSLIETFSRGMKQKLALVGALLHAPKILILDEPLTGLDAEASRHMKDVLLQYVKEGNTVILTTHIMEVAERLAEKIGIISNGKLLAEGSLEELRTRTGCSGTLEEVFLSLVKTS